MSMSPQLASRLLRGTQLRARSIKFLNGSEGRYLEFRDGDTDEAGLSVAYKMLGDVHLTQIGGVKRCEILETIVFSG